MDLEAGLYQEHLAVLKLSTVFSFLRYDWSLAAKKMLLREFFISRF